MNAGGRPPAFRCPGRLPMDDVALALSNYLLAIADDELILGHRNSEWCGHAPILEEDIAFANLALDEIGHAFSWYGLMASLSGEEVQRFPDRVVYTRPAHEYRCIQMVELPNGDWAFSMLRQYLFDAAENVRLLALQNSQYTPLAETAGAIRREELYHLRHTQAWIRRLGLGTDESSRRLQAALDKLWPYTFHLFWESGQDALLPGAGLVPEQPFLQGEWEVQVIPFLRECGLTLPEAPLPALQRREHTPYLDELLAEMQSVARMDPEAEW
jgi:ring-1,2-phenylacetyl-CoA epoxidase subunit PaaC